jgi:hypothetical protein
VQKNFWVRLPSNYVADNSDIALVLVLRDSYCGVQKNFGVQSPSCFLDGSCQYNYAYEDSTSTYGQVALETLTLTELTAGGSTFPVENFVFGCGWGGAS